MLRLFGSVHNHDVVTITSLFLKWSVNETLIKEFIQLVKILEKGIVRRNPFATPRLSSSKTKLGQLNISRKSISRSVSATSLTNFATNNSDVSNWTIRRAKQATI